MIHADVVEIQTTEIREFQIGLSNLTDTEKILKCGNEQTIHLVSYKYHQLKCRFVDDCSSVHEEPLLPEEVFYLHQMCSLQQQCRIFSFPLRSKAQRNRTNSIIIRYECIGKYQRKLKKPNLYR